MSALADALGRNAVVVLSGLIGGRSIRVPLAPDATSARTFERPATEARARLAHLVGDRLATELIANFGGSRVYIPRGPTSHSRTRPVDARRVDRLTKRGLSASIIAHRLGCTERCVYRKRAQIALRRKDRK